ncbi:hypothetical protein RM704_10715 [Streptomyces sp. DSM 3412]|uniref:Uncharacterized protein n=1 Tax=Streptomyces gottesmaniae TaxID=3075518 RepID=A0ABU2YUE0_9ACTN|nr:hypothetical protein [Streptomyces sp. DSM 3412]MDT0567937.1 hypothetical protein [Streptomyces sp. DSM 3412]
MVRLRLAVASALLTLGATVTPAAAETTEPSAVAQEASSGTSAGTAEESSEASTTETVLDVGWG